MNQVICKAISDRKILAFYYDSCYRVVEPYTLGISPKSNVILSAFQIDGQKASGKPLPDWGQFNLDKILDLQVLDRKFDGIAPDYKRGNTKMTEIFCELE